MDAPRIKNFEEFLQPVVKGKIIKYSTKLLTAAGENYGSVLLAVDVLICNNNGVEENLSVVAKICPQNEWLKKMFASTVTFRKEIGFYLEIIPTFIEFQKENNIKELLSIFPRCLNARFCLDPNSNQVDDDAVLLLENLKLKNYQILDRLVGFNLLEAEIVIRDLAQFHAVPLAYKIKNPDGFKSKVVPFLERVFIGREMYDTVADKFTESIARYLTLNEEESRRFVAGMNKGYDFQRNFPVGNEQYATVVHCDFWLNNTLIKFENNKPIKNKMLDFQSVTYGPPAADVIFFLFTSLTIETLDKYYNHLLEVYFQTFINCLQELNCDVSKYTYDSFQKEINIYGALEGAHVLVMFRPIFQDAKHKNMDEMKVDDMFNEEGITDIYKNRIKFTVKKFFDLNWF